MDVFSIRPEGLQGTNDVEWNLGLVGTHEHLNSERPTVQCTNVFRLNVLEINKHKAFFQIRSFGPIDVPSSLLDRAGTILAPMNAPPTRGLIKVHQ